MMTQKTLLTWYSQFEKVIRHLPGPIQKAILDESQPVKDLILEQRPPRILLAGPSTVSLMEVINSLFHEQVIAKLDDYQPPAEGWETFRRIGRGTVQILDSRNFQSPQWQAGRESIAPDLILFLGTAGESTKDLFTHVARLEATLQEIDLKFKIQPTVMGILETAGQLDSLTVASQALESALRSSSTVNKNFSGVILLDRWSRFRADGSSPETEKIHVDLNDLLITLIDELPTPAKLEMARISGIKSAQKKIADVLIKAVTAVSAAVGAQPIPLADMPILMGLQSGMVAGIIYISGGELNARSALKFIGALGLNVGVALVLRESARAAAKLVPGWGYAISGAVAAGGTMAIGRAASGFFIDKISLGDARKLFQRKKQSSVEIAVKK